MGGHTTLISSESLHTHISDPAWLIVDCRFSLAAPAAGRQEYSHAHIPGAVFADLEKDLSGPVIPGQTGRHPLPTAASAAKTFSAWGLSRVTQVVVYDNSAGSIAARLWWMLRWLGHSTVAVLDGGWQGWVGQGYPVEEGVVVRKPSDFNGQIRPELVAKTADILGRLGEPSWRIVDAREPARYRGESEPIDPVAGRIPSAVNFPHETVIDASGHFLPVEELKTIINSQIGDVPAGQTIFYCGSGVTAARGLLAMAHAGLGDGRLYPGSWSEWITDPGRPIERG